MVEVEVRLVEIKPPDRDYPALFKGLAEILRGLDGRRSPNTILRTSFEAAATGFKAQKGLLLRVDNVDPPAVHVVLATAKVSSDAIEAVNQGASRRGISLTTIRNLVKQREAILVLHPANKDVMASTGYDGFSVLCAPIFHPTKGNVIALLYLQHALPQESYNTQDLDVLRSYADAIGRVFGYHLDVQRRMQEIQQLRAGHIPKNAPLILGESPQTRGLRERLLRSIIPSVASRRPRPILITGDPGTGKGLVAEFIWAFSARGHRPSVVANCGSLGLNQEIASAEFFGTETGAFTGSTLKKGYFRSADGGVLFLDEIDALPLAIQRSLLRVLQDRTVSPVGSSDQITVDVQVIVASNKNLEDEVAAKRFAPDLWARIKGCRIHLPPLADRPEDVPHLLEHYRLKHGADRDKATLGWAKDAFDLLCQYSWPDNVREVDTTVGNLVDGVEPFRHIDLDLIDQIHPEIRKASPNPKASTSLRGVTRGFQREVILRALEETDWDRISTARRLGISLTSLGRYIRNLGIQKASTEDGADDSGGRRT